MTPLKLDDVLAHPVPIGAKGMPRAAAGLPLSSIGRQGWNLLKGDIPFPACILKRSALEHNRAIMKRFIADAGVLLAPHGKTTMAPQLFAQQIEDGAWALTAATPAHLVTYRALGVSRIFYANQLIDPTAITFVLDELARDPTFEFLCLVDSPASVRLLQQAAAVHSGTRPIDVLIEIGMPGRRCGVRTLEQALSLAAEIRAAAPALRLRGVEAFEGVVPIDAKGAAEIRSLLAIMSATACAIAAEGGQSGLIVSAGGSAFFPLVASEMRNWPAATEIILRSGCYITNDHGMYAHAQTLDETQGTTRLVAPFEPALEVWSHVQSRPEKGLAILAVGKRDISHDIEMPRPIWRVRRGENKLVSLGAECRIAGLNDQHAMMNLPETHDLEIGDLVALGCSHPCTTFDKWRHLLVVGDDYEVTDAISTFF